VPEKVSFARSLEEGFFKFLMIVSLILVVGSLASVFVLVVIKGLPSLSLEMLTSVPKGGYYLGKEGGILNAIAGSLYLAVGATLIAIAVGIPAAMQLHDNKSGSKMAYFVRRSLEILWAIPSIIYGSFGFTIMVLLGMQSSLLGGMITLSLLELPIIVRALDEVMRTVPVKLKEASYALGAGRIRTILDVTVRQSLPGIVTAVTLAFGRAIGDAASVLYTAGYTDSIPNSLFDPAASLPLAIFFQLGTPFPAVQQRAYASALVLLVIVLGLNVSSRLVARRYSKFLIR
jgi:phosphate transport system permease protein